MSHPEFGGDHEVVSARIERDNVGDAGALVTVMRKWGSSSHLPGSLLAVRRRDRLIVGSLSGGCIDTDLVECYMASELSDCPTTADCGVYPAGAARDGLPYGGRLELLAEEPEAVRCK
jgi:xanthine dehydrogenase accessory factor